MSAQYSVPDSRLAEFGKLIIDWSLGVKPHPTTLAQFKNVIVTQLGGSISKEVKTFDVLVAREDHIVLRLPPANLIEAMMAEIAKPTTNYPLPAFYENDVFKAPSKIVASDIPGKTKLYENRIGDYSLGQCG